MDSARQKQGGAWGGHPAHGLLGPREQHVPGDQDKLWFYLISGLFTILMIIFYKVQMAAVSVVPSILDFLSDEVILPWTL